MNEHPQVPHLTQDDFQAIIDLVVAYTGREPDKTLVETWAAQAAIGKWTYPEASTAIHLWMSERTPRDFLEPSDITRKLRDVRRKAAATFEPPRIPDGLANADYPAWHRQQLASHCDRLVQRWAVTGEEPPVQLPPGPPANQIGQRRVAELTAGAFHDMPSATPTGEVPTSEAMSARSAAYAEPCPFCHAQPDEPCTRPSAAGRVRIAHPHPARYEAVSAEEAS